MIQTRLTRFSLTLLLLCFTATPVFALKSDKNQPVVIDADNMEIDMQSGVRIYTGNVTVKQGSLVIHGDKIVVRYKDDKVDTATAYGKPAKFRQRPEGKDQDVRGRAPKMILDETRNKMFMYQNAVLIRGSDNIHSREIHYNMTTDKMTVKGGATASTGGAKTTQPSKPGRAHIVIQPKDTGGK
jgi:lipopolysaccharide export system protein LptA